MSHQYCLKKEIDLTKHKVIEVLGSGSNGIVYLVQEKGTHNKYAMKTMKTMKTSPENIETTYREIEIMMFSNNPTLIKCSRYSINDNTKENQISILMEYAQKGSLDKVLKNIQNGFAPDGYSNTTRQIILIGIARAMKYLHDRNIVHRDLKPGNILLNDKLRPLVADFGFSKFLNFKNQFAQSQNCGTYIYMTK